MHVLYLLRDVDDPRFDLAQERVLLREERFVLLDELVEHPLELPQEEGQEECQDGSDSAVLSERPEARC